MLGTIIVNAFACFFSCFLLCTPVEEEGLRNLWSGVTPAILRHIGKLNHSNTPIAALFSWVKGIWKTLYIHWGKFTCHRTKFEGEECVWSVLEVFRRPKSERFGRELTMATCKWRWYNSPLIVFLGKLACWFLCSVIIFVPVQWIYQLCW